VAGRHEEKRKALLREAQRHVEKGAHAKAAVTYEKALALDPGDLRAMRRLGDVYSRLERSGDARRTYLRVADGHEKRGMVLMAVGALKAILAIDPSDAEANDRLAACFVSLGLFPEATRSLAAAAEAHEEGGDAESAIKTRRQLNAIEPDNLVNALRLAELLSICGDREGCLGVYHGALRHVRADSPGSNTFLRVAERVLELAPDDAKLMREVAEIHLKRGDTSEVVRWLDRSLSVSPNDPATLGAYARLFEKTGRTSELEAVAVELARVSEMPPPGPPDDTSRSMDPASPERAPSSGGGGAGMHIRVEGSGSSAIPPVAAPRRPPRRPSVPPRASILPLPIAASSAPAPLPIAASGAPAPLPIADSGTPAPLPIADSGAPAPLPIADSGALAPLPIADSDARPLSPPPPERPADGDMDAPPDGLKDFEILLIDYSEALAGDEACQPDDDDEVIASEADEPSGEVDDMVLVVQREVERLLHGVEVLLEFDAVDKALDVSTRALELAPGSERAQALHRLALYRSGAAQVGEISTTTPPGRSK